MAEGDGGASDPLSFLTPFHLHLRLHFHFSIPAPNLTIKGLMR